MWVKDIVSMDINIIVCFRVVFLGDYFFDDKRFVWLFFV